MSEAATTVGTARQASSFLESAAAVLDEAVVGTCFRQRRRPIPIDSTGASNDPIVVIIAPVAAALSTPEFGDAARINCCTIGAFEFLSNECGMSRHVLNDGHLFIWSLLLRYEACPGARRRRPRSLLLFAVAAPPHPTPYSLEPCNVQDSFERFFPRFPEQNEVGIRHLQLERELPASRSIRNASLNRGSLYDPSRLERRSLYRSSYRQSPTAH